MKNLFAFNLNSHEGEGAFSANGAKYITARAEASASNELDASEKNLQSVKKRAAPWWLLLLAELFLVGGIFVLAVFVLPGDDESWAEMYGKFPWAVYAGTGAVVLGIALFALCAIRKKHIADNVEYKNADARVQKALGRIKESLCIPAGAPEVDVLAELYKIGKDGKIRPRRRNGRFYNIPFYVYLNGDCLCFARPEAVYSIPLSSFVCIYKINKSVNLTFWNKAVPFNKPPYKQFKIRASQYGMKYVKPYYAVSVREGEEECCVYVPSYELEKILGLKSMPVL